MSQKVVLCRKSPVLEFFVLTQVFDLMTKMTVPVVFGVLKTKCKNPRIQRFRGEGPVGMALMMFKMS